MSTDSYGRYYWCVKTSLSEDKEIYLHADFVEINENGDALFIQEKEQKSAPGAAIERPKRIVNLCLASGSWSSLFAASVMDGHAVAVDHWKGEVQRNLTEHDNCHRHP